ncbi:MAG: hypothetical protein ACI9RU_001535 [Litorivivens sp.]|jgi:hypothetical protein
MKNFRLFALVLILLTSGYVAFKTYEQEQQKVELKQDLIELSKIKYGLFNVDEWKLILADIMTKKIEEFDLDDTSREKMRAKISNLLTVIINDLEASYYEKKSKSFLGILQSGVANITGTFGVMKEDVPVFTEQILNFLSDKDNRAAIQEYLVKKLNEYADKTFSATDYSQVSSIVERYNQEDIVSTKNYLEVTIKQVEAESRTYRIILVIIAAASLLIIAFVKGFKVYELSIGLIISLVFLVLGILLPMIEIDARISEMTFSLLGEEVKFVNQVLYYKSKSILEVVELMIMQSRLDLIAVGFLVLTFSVLFPFSKLISSGIYLHNQKLKSNRFISFMVFKSGKWSMADVMVMAIFMAYIGFDGIISEQLTQLETLTTNLDMLTTNKSNLLFGFYSFTLFVLLSLITSQKIQTTINKD